MRIPPINLTFVDFYRAMDAAPLPNIVTNGLINLSVKGVLFTAALLNRPFDISKSEFLSHVYKKSTARCIILTVPVFGYISVAIYDRIKSKGKSEITDEPKKDEVAEAKKDDVAEAKKDEVAEAKKDDVIETKPKGKEKEISQESRKELKEDKRTEVAIKTDSSVSSQTMIKPRNITEEIYTMFQDDWELSDNTYVNIIFIWISIFGKARFIDFKAVDKSKGLYKFTLEKALNGISPTLPGSVNISKEVSVSFISEGDKKILTFEGDLPCLKKGYVTMGFVKQIVIENEDVKVTTWLGPTVRFSTAASATDSMTRVLAILQSINWEEVN